MALNPFTYLKESKAELEKVVWPSRTETIKMTVLVLIVSLLVGAYIAGMDALFTLLVETYLNKS